MATVGIIANPASGKDIRRLVSYGTTFDNLQKVSIVRRIIVAIAQTGVDKVIYMPDYYGLVPRALEGLFSTEHMTMVVEPLEMDMTGLQEDSQQAAEIMQEMGVDCIVTLGGDGTNRVVARGCGDIPLVPVSTGTNNVFPQMIEGTIAGLVAGVTARGMISDENIIRTKKLHILQDDTEINTALIDAVVLNDVFIGSRAIWDEEHLEQIIVTRGEPDTIGISSIAGNLEPIDIKEERGLYINVGPGKITVSAPIAPGLFRPVPIKDYHVITLLEKVPVIDGPCIIALDGEREVEVGEGDRYYIQLKADGPRVVDTRRALREAVKRGYAIKEK